MRNSERLYKVCFTIHLDCPALSPPPPKFCPRFFLNSSPPLHFVALNVFVEEPDHTYILHALKNESRLVINVGQKLQYHVSRSNRIAAKVQHCTTVSLHTQFPCFYTSKGHINIEFILPHSATFICQGNVGLIYHFYLWNSTQKPVLSCLKIW